jgi:hypothetical protein
MRTLQILFNSSRDSAAISFEIGVDKSGEMEAEKDTIEGDTDVPVRLLDGQLNQLQGAPEENRRG